MFNPLAEKYSSIYLTKKNCDLKKIRKLQATQSKQKINRCPEEKKINPVD